MPDRSRFLTSIDRLEIAELGRTLRITDRVHLLLSPYDLNVQVAQARANDGNRPDSLYVGLLPSGIPIANVGGCNSSGVSAVPSGQQWTMSHELGHAAGADLLVHALEPGRHSCRVVARDDGGSSEARTSFTITG